MAAAEKGVQRAEDPFKDNKEFMRYCDRSSVYSKMKNAGNYNKVCSEFIYYLEHQRPAPTQKKDREAGEWIYDPGYASGDNGPWHYT